jgi:hypothetical protein
MEMEATPVCIISEPAVVNTGAASAPAVRNTHCLSFSGREGSTSPGDGARTGSGLAQRCVRMFSDFCGGRHLVTRETLRLD